MTAVLEVREPNTRLIAKPPQSLIRGFDLLTTTPNGVEKLRGLIRSMAVRGLLVPQDPSDESTTELLKRMRQMSSARAAKALQPEDAETSAPYKLPPKWAWSQLGALVENMGSGWSPACDEGERADPDRWAVLRTTAVQILEYRPQEHKAIPLELAGRPGIEVRKDDILITRAGPMNRVGISCWVSETPPKLMLSDKIVRMHPITAELLPAFVVLALNAGWTKDQLEDAKTGMAASQVNISQSDLQRMVLPICSTSEQRRIVARVEELMKLCDALEQTGRLADEQHARLTSTLFDALAGSESAHALAENWGRVAEHFDLLLDRPEAVDALEQTVLQLAVRGLLVPQDATEEPASSLLARVRSERDRLISAGQIRRDKPALALDDDEVTVALPRTWEWARFGALIDASEAGWSPNCEGGPRAGASWGVLKVSAVSWGQFRPHENKELPKHFDARAEFEVKDGDFLISRANTAELVARSVVVSNPEPRLMLSDKIIRLRLSKLVNGQFFNLVNNGRMAREYYAANASGTSNSMKNIGREVILRMPVPVPPLAEQRRIVARVEQLRSLCADLRDRLLRAREAQSRIADALVADVTS